MCFRDVFWSGFRVVLGMCWDTFWCQNEKQKAKGGFVKMLVLVSNIHVFVVCGFHFGCQNERKIEWDSDLDSNSVLW